MASIEKFPRIKTACFDIESNGLLQWGEWYKWDARFGTPRPPMDKIHVLVIRDYERKINYIFRHNEFENTIEQGLEMLEDAELVVGMNIIHFDIPAFSLVFNDVNFRGQIFDTLPMVRMIFANQKDKDFRLAERKLLPGGLIGSNSLESWGIRLGLHKGDYVKECEALGIDPWGEWSQEMEDYCILDVAVTVLLYERCLASNWAPEAIEMEHCIHDLMGQQERNGIPFDVDGARLLENSLRHEAGLLQTELVDHFGKWWAPEKKIVVKQQWEYPDGFDAPVKKYGTPNPLHGESYDRAIWGEVTIPKRDRNVKSKEFPGTTVRYSTEAPYCKIELKEFNPGSRVQIIDRLSLVYNWHPVDFTEKGNPEVNDDVLRKLVEKIPMAEKLAELFYYEKRLGQVADGKNGWLRKVDPDGFIHHYCNVGGTISGRASHIGPNLGQVPRVAFVPLLDDNGLPVFNDKGKPKMRIGKGREGDHGWDCRNLFYVPNPWIMVGCDLSGIELRCFGEQLAKYDGGEYLELVLRGDIHTYNQHLAGLPTRDMAKTFIYALIYGAGDVKLGSIARALASEDEQRGIGKELRARFMGGLPAFAKVVHDIQKQARQGWLPGLDGRRLFVRSKHAALNTKLQSDAALIAKKWNLITEHMLTQPEDFPEAYRDLGLEQIRFTNGWKGDLVQLLWIHDEIQQATLGDPEHIKAVTIKAANLAGLHFGYTCPIDAEGKYGHTWAETH